MTRIGAGINLLLVAVAFKLSVSANLPLISYLTYLDVYMLGVILYLCVNIIIFAFLSLIKDVQATARLADKITVSILIVLMIIAHVSYALVFVSRTNIPIGIMLGKDQKYEEELYKLKKRKNSKVVKVVARQIPPPRNCRVSNGRYSPGSYSRERHSPIRDEESQAMLPIRVNEIRRQGNYLQSI